MRLEFIVIGVLVGGLFFTGLLTVFKNIGDNNNATYSTSDFNYFENSAKLEEQLDKINATTTMVSEANQQYQNASLTEGGDYGQFKMKGILDSMYNSVANVNSIFVIMGTVLGIPSYIIYVLLAILGIVALITLIYLIMGR